MSGDVPPLAGALPRSFGPYLLFDTVGRGGMASIFLAKRKTDLGAARLCVVKQILPELSSEVAFADMFVFEAKLAAGLCHQNIVQTFDLGREDGRLYIAMEYVEGTDLNALQRRCQETATPLPFAFALHVACGALRGLDYAHRKKDDLGTPLGIVHRDVSPSNVLVSFDGEVKVCDFGIAHANDLATKDAATIVDAAIQGKAGYMSPEHARGEPLDPRADVFAAGIVLWELLAGRRLYRGGTKDRNALLEEARRAEIPRLPARLDVAAPPRKDLEDILRRALERDRTARFPSAAAFLRELETFAAETRTLASPIGFGEFLGKLFGPETLARRRARERAAEALSRGPALVITPIAPPLSLEEPAPAPEILRVSRPRAPSVPASEEIATTSFSGKEGPRVLAPGSLSFDELAKRDHDAFPPAKGEAKGASAIMEALKAPREAPPETPLSPGVLPHDALPPFTSLAPGILASPARSAGTAGITGQFRALAIPEGAEAPPPPTRATRGRSLEQTLVRVAFALVAFAIAVVGALALARS